MSFHLESHFPRLVARERIKTESDRHYANLYIYKLSLQPDGYKLSILLIFHTNSKPIWRLENLASREASIYYTASRI